MHGLGSMHENVNLKEDSEKLKRWEIEAEMEIKK